MEYRYARIPFTNAKQNNAFRADIVVWLIKDWSNVNASPPNPTLGRLELVWARASRPNPVRLAVPRSSTCRPLSSCSSFDSKSKRFAPQNVGKVSYTVCGFSPHDVVC